MMTGLRNLWYSFPIQLLLLHLRSHLFLFMVWLTLFLLMSGHIAKLYGFKYLILTPEYLGHVDSRAFLLMGIAFGWLTMTWHLTCYLIHAYRFPFLASLSRPFTQFMINNSVLPLIFLILFVKRSVSLQMYAELVSYRIAWTNMAAFLLGLLLFLSVTILFFWLTNIDLPYLQRKKQHRGMLKQPLAPGVSMAEIEAVKLGTYSIHVETYIGTKLRPRLVRSVAHYDTATMLQIFRQNHRNAIIWLTMGVSLLILSSLLLDYPALQPPAGASIFLLAGILIAISGGITYWLHKWRHPVFAAFIFVVHVITSREQVNWSNRVFGLNYDVQPASYDYHTFESLASPEIVTADSLSTINQLNNWKKNTGQTQPIMIIMSASGGGLRAALWAAHVVGQLDSITQGKALRHTVLLTGASGGTMGLGFIREVYWRSLYDPTIRLCNDKYFNMIGTDLLNRLSFSFVCNDMFYPLATGELHGRPFLKDRAWYFEEQLRLNTGGLLDRTVVEYKNAEQQGLIPTLITAPIISADSRRLLIGAQGLSYLMRPVSDYQQRDFFEIDGLDFRRFFSNHNADNIRLVTALRLNATYPLILPGAGLPTEPYKTAMDAGFRDNFGTALGVRFVSYFRQWIKENTAGVVFIQINGWDKLDIIEPDGRGLFNSLASPLSATFRSIEVQDFELDAQLAHLDILLGGVGRLQLVRFVYRNSKGSERASVSFHLTQREKNDIRSAILLKENQNSLRRVSQLLK